MFLGKLVASIWENLSLRGKFLALVVPLTCAATLAFFLVAENRLSGQAREDLHNRMDELAKIQSGSISGPLWSFNQRQLELVISSMINDPDLVGVAVYDDTGTVLASDGELDTTVLQQTHQTEVPVFFNNNGEATEVGRLRLVYTEDRLTEATAARRFAALVATAFLVIGLIVSAFVGLYYTVSVPLGRFATAIAQAGGSDQPVPVDWNTSDEMGHVAGAYNQLQAQQKSDAAELRRIQDNLEDLVAQRTEALKKREAELVRARDEAQNALAELQRTQDRLVQSQKMASLGQLSAGIAHEIKNPLNFVNNFALTSGELLNELREVTRQHTEQPSNETTAEIEELVELVSGNLEKINRHGQRADNIVRNMLLHSRQGPGKARLSNVNAIVEEAVNLAFHSARAEIDGFNISIEKDLQESIEKVGCFPQELSRVFINLAANAMYSTHQRARASEPGYEPHIRIATSEHEGVIRIDISDNGEGIPEAARATIFEPFYTSKPPGEGTGLGLSISYDIVTKTHQGEILLDSAVGVGSTFSVLIPRAQNAVEELEA